jgi:putative Mg2+ transporter-C (MgtC) family protein
MCNDLLTIATRIIVAGLLGGLIGLERDIHGRPAGLRTHILVSIGSALFMIISVHIYDKYSSSAADSILRIDPGRIAAQVITGVGFLGAGAILRSGINIRGLTTAGCIWVSAAVGMAAGLSYYMPAVITTAVALVTLVFLNKLEHLYMKDSYRQLRIKVENRENIVSDVISQIKKSRIDVRYCEYTKDLENNFTEVLFSLRIFHKGLTDKKSHDLINSIEKSIHGVKSISWEKGKDL